MPQKDRQDNTFTGGMDKATAVERLPEDRYVDAYNLVPITSNSDTVDFRENPVDSGRNFRLSNVDGDEWFLEFPDIPGYRTAELCLTVTDEASWSYEFEVWATLSAQTKLVQVSSAGDGTINQQILQAFEGDNNFYAIQECDCIVIGLKDPMAHGTGPNGPYIFGIVKSNVDDTNTTFPIAAQEGLKPVGWQVAGGELVVVTTAAQTPDEGGTPNYGQVWWMDVRDPNATVTPELKVNAQFNVSWEYRCWVDYTIENECTKRVTFGNESIPLYTVNVGEEGVITRSVDTLQLFLQPRYATLDFRGFSINGSLKQGAYYYAHRYVSDSGAATEWSPLSDRLVVLENTDNDTLDANYEPYITSKNVGDASDKQALFRLTNLDLDYETVQVAYLYIDNEANEPVEASIFEEQDIISSEIELVHTGEEPIIEGLSTQDLILQGVTAASAKDGLVLNKRLHLLNICEQPDLDFDQKIGVGAGDIQYSFVTKNLWVDNILPSSIPSTGADQIAGINNSEPNGFTGEAFNDVPTAAFNAGVPNPPLQKNNGNLSYFKSGAVDFYLRGYMRREWYRFGIVFFLKTGGLTPVYWIGDIQMPAPYNYGGAPVADNLSEMVTIGTDDYITVRTLGIQFSNIDLSGFEDRVKGFSIVRSNRSGYVQGFGLSAWSGLGVVPDGPIIRSFSSAELDFTNGPTQLDAQPILETYFIPDPLNNGSGEFVATVTGGSPSGNRTIYGVKVYPDSSTPPSFVPPGTPPSYTPDLELEYGTQPFPSNVYRLPKRGAFGYSSNQAAQDYEVYAYQCALRENFNPFENIRVVADQLTNGTFSINASDFSLRRTEYYYTGHYQSLEDCSLSDVSSIDGQVFGGDTYAGIYDRTGKYVNPDTTDVLDAAGNVPFIYRADVFWVGGVLFPCESTHNFMARYAKDSEPEEVIFTQNQLMRKPEGFRLNRCVSEFGGFPKLQPREFFGECQECFPTTVVGSLPKVYGERINSYQTFPPENRAELDGAFGAGIKLGAFSDADINLLVWQEDLTSVVQVSPRQLTTTSGGDIGTSSIELYRDPQTVAQDIGTQHQWSVVRGVETYYWLDASRKELYRWGKGGAIEALGMQNFIAPYLERTLGNIATLDSPLLFGGLSSGYDFKRQQALFTFLYDGPKIFAPLDPPPPQWTLAYSEMLGAFTSFLGFQPQGYIHLPGNRIAGIGEGATDDTNYSNLYLLMQDPANNNVFSKNRSTKLEGTVEASRLVWVLNKYSGATKQPSALLLDISDLWEYLQVTTNPQRDALGNKLVWRGRMKIDDTPEFWQPRGGKWQGPVPFATDLKVGNNAWQDDSVLQPVQGEQIYFQISAATREHIDIFSASAAFLINKMNR